MTKKYQVFISSTFNDLQDERLAACHCILDNDCIPVGMEQFHALPLNQWDYIKKLIDDGDYYVLILAGRYGSIDEESGLGYTEKEFDYAVAQKIPVLAFLYDDLDNLPMKKSESDPERKQKLLAFRQKIENNGLRDTYSDINDLKHKISVSINKSTREFPRPGWIRNTQRDDVNIDALVELIVNKVSDKIKGQEEHITDEDIDKLFHNKKSNLSTEKVRQIVRDELDAHTATDEEVNAMFDEIFNKN